VIPCGGCTLILWVITAISFDDNGYFLRRKPPGNRKGLIGGSVVNNDNFLAWPGLGDGRPDRVGDPSLSVVCRNENRD
jgi:hypothetical protein